MVKGILVKGKDSAEFLQRLTAGKIRSLAVSEGTRGVLLNGQSRMIAQFDVLRVADDEFRLFAPVACVTAMADELEKLHFSEALAITQLPETYSPEKDSSTGELLFRFSDPNHWPSAVPGFSFSLKENVSEQEFHFARILALVPWTTDWNEQTPALEAAALPWIDRYKGCYPGQEVVEKSLNLGHPARVLQAYETEEDRPFGFAEGNELVPTSKISWQGKTRILVRVPWAKKDEAAPAWRKICGFVST